MIYFKSIVKFAWGFKHNSLLFFDKYLETKQSNTKYPSTLHITNGNLKLNKESRFIE